MTLIEKAEAQIDEEKAARTRERNSKTTELDFNDFLEQMQQMKKMGGLIKHFEHACRAWDCRTDLDI